MCCLVHVGKFPQQPRRQGTSRQGDRGVHTKALLTLRRASTRAAGVLRLVLAWFHESDGYGNVVLGLFLRSVLLSHRISPEPLARAVQISNSGLVERGKEHIETCRNEARYTDQTAVPLMHCLDDATSKAHPHNATQRPRPRRQQTSRAWVSPPHLVLGKAAGAHDSSPVHIRELDAEAVMRLAEDSTNKAGLFPPLLRRSTPAGHRRAHPARHSNYSSRLPEQSAAAATKTLRNRSSLRIYASFTADTSFALASKNNNATLCRWGTSTPVFSVVCGR